MIAPRSSFTKQCRQFLYREICRLFIVRELNPSDESMRRHPLKQTQGTLPAGAIAVRHMPDLSIGVHQINNKLTLLIGTIGAHKSYGVDVSALPEPPRRWEALDYEQVVDGCHDTVGIVQEE